MGHAYIEKRANARTHLSVPLYYIYPGSEADKSSDYLAASTFDISDSGVSFYTTRLLLDGDDIKIFIKDLWNEQRAGTVKWCKTLNYNYHLVGVSFH
jgi:hypothetical protein